MTNYGRTLHVLPLHTKLLL